MMEIDHKNFCLFEMFKLDPSKYCHIACNLIDHPLYPLCAYCGKRYEAPKDKDGYYNVDNLSNELCSSCSSDNRITEDMYWVKVKCRNYDCNSVTKRRIKQAFPPFCFECSMKQKDT